MTHKTSGEFKTWAPLMELRPGPSRRAPSLRDRNHGMHSVTGRGEKKWIHYPFLHSTLLERSQIIRGTGPFLPLNSPM